MSKEQMIYIIKNRLVHTIRKKHRKKIMELAFGKKFMKLPDDLKGTLQPYEEVE